MQTTPKSKAILLLISSLLLLQFLPYFLLGEGSYVRIHDNLEAEWLWYHMLVQTGTAWDYGSVVKPVMNGLTRDAFHTGLNFNLLWLSLFGTFWGYVANYVFVHLLGFGGMYLLLRKHFLQENNQQYIALGVALCFAWVPYFTALGITVAGQPLLFFAFLNLLKGQGRWWNWLLVVWFPFYASIVWAAPAVLGLLAIIGIADYFGNEKKNSNYRQYVGAMLLLSVVFLLVNFQLIGLMLDSDFVSHREEYDYFYDKELSFLASIEQTALTFLIAHYHVGIFIGIPVVLMASASFYYKGETFLIKSLLLLIIAVCLFYGFYNYVVYFLGDLPLVATLKFERVNVLLPFLWCLLMALSLRKINQQRQYSTYVIVFMVVQFIIITFSNDEFLHNMRQMTGQATKPSYREYIAKDLFNEIKKHINRPAADYRVASVGMNPGIAQMNGLYTLDGLQAIYDLNYKKKFRLIIKEELEKDTTLKNYFDGWGNRCYLFSSELGKEDSAFLIGKNQGEHLKNFDINTAAMKQLGGDYLISALPIDNYKELDLALDKTFEDTEAYWKIYLYKNEQVVH